MLSSVASCFLWMDMKVKADLEQMHALANSVRRAYNRLRYTTDVLHQDLGVSAPKRTLLMDLHRYGPQTVPQLAAERFISRQIIQSQVNELQRSGYLMSQPNPAHKRSSLIALTDSGHRLVRHMIAAEQAYLEKTGWVPDADEVANCIDLLDEIFVRLGV